MMGYSCMQGEYAEPYLKPNLVWSRGELSLTMRTSSSVASETATVEDKIPLCTAHQWVYHEQIEESASESAGNETGQN